MSTPRALAAWHLEEMNEACLPRSEFSLRARLRSVEFALQGLRALLTSQHNAWVHAAATVVVVALGSWARLERLEWLALVFAIVMVWAAEAMNTAFEALCDVASPEFHPLVARAKDIAAGAVLLCAAGAVVVGAIVFLPRVVP